MKLWQELIDLGSYGSRWCQKEQTTINFKNLPSKKCWDCENFLFKKEGTCDPL